MERRNGEQSSNASMIGSVLLSFIPALRQHRRRYRESQSAFLKRGRTAFRNHESVAVSVRYAWGRDSVVWVLVQACEAAGTG